MINLKEKKDDSGGRIHFFRDLDYRHRIHGPIRLEFLHGNSTLFVVSTFKNFLCNSCLRMGPRINIFLHTDFIFKKGKLKAVYIFRLCLRIYIDGSFLKNIFSSAQSCKWGRDLWIPSYCFLSWDFYESLLSLFLSYYHLQKSQRASTSFR